MSNKPKFASPVDIIKRIVAREYNVPLSKMVASQRPRKWAWPRQVAMALTREFTDLTQQEVGVHFGGRDHGTVMHAERVVADCASRKDALLIAALRNEIAQAIHNAV